MEIRVLGHLEASVDDQPVALGGAKQRAVLAMLALDANRTVTADRLSEGLWGEDRPPSAAKMVQNYVWLLRRTLNGGAEILTHGRAYELRIDAEHVDSCRLERLVSEAAHEAGAGDRGDAARAALALFRGEPLADVADEPFAGAEIRRLEDLRLTAAELAIEADLACGRHQHVVAEIDALLAENPLRERLHAQRMLALYRCGRQAEALEAYHQVRATVVEEIGVEPGPELQRLHEAILRQEPSLDVDPAVTDLHHELDAAAAPPLVGRDAELERLRALWQRAAAGTGALVTLAGGYGMGKTRLAAELASAAHRDGAAVLYAPGTGPPDVALAAIARARDAQRPALLVIDDADRAPTAVRVALRDLELDRAPALVLATGLQAAALARLEPRESIALEALGADGVAAIAGLYAPAGRAVPVDALLTASGGVPRRVHEAAGEWARREATRRVDAAADRAAAGRSEARALEDELAEGVAELQSARERTDHTLRDDDERSVVCPYKGLATFEADDADYFFGRERLVADLVAHVVGAPLLAVVGPSGSGKSSVVRAGLLPALAGGVLPGSDNWTQALIRPGEQPLRALRRATRRLAHERHGVLAVDQFEELFTGCQDEEEREDFAAALVRYARSGDGVVVLTVRADFYGHCAAYPELARLLGANHVLVGAMSRDELRRAIEQPAQRAGLTVEPELVEALLADVEGQPGALPLLSTTLLELWRGRERRQLRLAAYASSGGVQGAVARLAEDAFIGLDPGQQAIARELLLRLADEDESGAIVRRRVALDELDAKRTAVVSRLVERRLLTAGDGAVEVAHEALLREWPRLRTWLDEDAEGRRLHRRVEVDARAWDADARDAGELYRGARLASALDWAATHDPELSGTERAFLDAGRHAAGRAQRRLRLVLAGVASLLVLAVIAGLVALDQRGAARAEATTAAAQRLGAQALTDTELDRSLLLARQGVALDDSPQTRGNLLAALLRSPAAIGVLHSGGPRVNALDLSPDGRTLAVLDASGTLRLLDARTQQRIAPLQTVEGVSPFDTTGFEALRFSPDSARLAVGGSDAGVLDARTGRRVASLGLESQFVTGIRFSADGRTLSDSIGDSLGGRGIAIQRFDSRTGRALDVPKFPAGPPNPSAPLVMGDGRRLVTSLEGGPTAIRDARTLRVLKTWPEGAAHASLGPNDRTLLLGGSDGSVRFLDLVTGEVRRAAGSHDGAVVRAAFSATGRIAVTAGEDQRAMVWDVRRAAAIDTLAGHTGQITGLAITRDDRTLYSSALDGKVLIWDLAGDRRLGRPFPTGRDDSRQQRIDIGAPGELPSSPVVMTALSPDGRTLAVGHSTGTVTLVDAGTLQARSTFRVVPTGPVAGIGFEPRTGLLLASNGHGRLAFIDPDTGTIVRRESAGTQFMPETAGTQFTPSFSANGQLMATLDDQGAVRLWTLRAGLPAGTPRLYYPTGYASEVSLSPDGRTLAVTSGVGVRLIDVATLKPRMTLAGASGVLHARFTPDGRSIVGGSSDGWARLWSATTGRPVTRAFRGHTGAVLWESISPDGHTLATGSVDGTIQLFDLQSQRSLGAPLTAIPNRAVAPLFTPDGATLFAVTNAGRGYRWDIRPSSWERHACAVAGRTLTRAEWDDALPGRPYAPAC